MIADFIKMLIGGGMDFVKKKQDIKLGEMKAVQEIKIRSMQSADNWEQMTAAKSSRFLRWMLAGHLMLMIDASIYMSLTGFENPSIIFDTIHNMPNWTQGLLATVFGFAFGAAPLKAAGAKLFTAGMSAFGKKK